MSLFDALLDEDLSSPPIVTREVYIALRTDGGIGATGSTDNPFDGSTATKFDAIMREKVLPNTTVYIGPGVFETEGGYAHGNIPPVIPWWPESGRRIIGSGVHSTTLKLVRSGPRPNDGYSVVKVNPAAEPDLNGFQISDLTIDCSLGGLPSTPGLDYPRVGANAISFRGRNVRIRRVRVINFGTRTEKQECFPIIISTPQSGGMMNCVVVFGKLNCAQFARTKFCCEGVSLVWSRLSRSCPF